MVSRSALDAPFRSVLDRSPVRYLREWRMHVARDLLSTTTLTVGAVARRVGYDSEEAFSRAFERTLGAAPAHRRAERSRVRASHPLVDDPTPAPVGTPPGDVHT